jgi:aminopeptidase N
VEILIRVLEPTSEITLHYRQINIVKIEQRRADNLIFRKDLEFYTIPSHDFLKVNLTEVSNVGDEFLLDIQYVGVLRGDGAGFYRAYYDENGIRVWYGTTQFQISDARHAMPCYDEPGIRAPIQLSIIHGANYHAISNTPIDRVEPFGIYRRTIFEPTPPMQTYLLAFLVSPFEYVSNNDTRVEQRIYAKPESIRNSEADYAINLVKPMLEKFEEYLNFNFPLRKMDHAAITQVLNLIFKFSL